MSKGFSKANRDHEVKVTLFSGKTQGTFIGGEVLIQDKYGRSDVLAKISVYEDFLSC